MTVNDTFLTEDEAIDLYDNMIDEGGPVIVSGMEFVASHALKLLDPIAYRTGFSDFADMLVDDGYEIEGY
jgi:hypothetical protein